MIPARPRIIAVWLACMAAAVWVVVHAHYVTDLSAFLPARPTPAQRLLVDQLRDGPASRLLLIGLQGGDAAGRADISRKLAARLRSDARFADVNNGEPLTAERDREFLFQHRYLLSDNINAEHFTPQGLRASIEDTVTGLASPAGLMMKELVPHDPTGEMLHIIDRLAHTHGPRTQDGVWVSKDGSRAVLVAQTVAAGSDTDAQEAALDSVRTTFAAAVGAAGSTASGVQLRATGPGVFAVAARDKIKSAAMRLSLISSVLVICLLLAVYRSAAALALGLLPVATGALAGIAAVALGFGVVHGVTLGFGITLIGESVDYSIYFFLAVGHDWQRRLWPTIRLGMLTSVCGFTSLLPSGFPGLAQLGMYSISGLIAAALVTRFVLPMLLPRGFKVHDVAPWGARIASLRERALGRDTLALGAIGLVAILAAATVWAQRNSLWNHELAALSPIPLVDQRYDATLRADLGAADVLDWVVVSAADLDDVLRGAERAGRTLKALVANNVIGDFDTPADLLPSLATQRERRDSLPDRRRLQHDLRLAVAGSDLSYDQLAPYIDDVQTAREAPLLGPQNLRGTSLAGGFNALILKERDRWTALLSLHSAVAGMAQVDTSRIADALTADGIDAQVLDMKQQTDSLYADYLGEAIKLSCAGFALIVVLLSIALRSVSRVLRVLAPLMVAVLVVIAALTVNGVQLTIMHLVGMLLIVAVGSNYALFFDHQGNADQAHDSRLTLASLLVANISTVIAFGLLAFSQVPVLEALGTTVAPGAFLALLFSALITAPRDIQQCAAST